LWNGSFKEDYINYSSERRMIYNIISYKVLTITQKIKKGKPFIKSLLFNQLYTSETASGNRRGERARHGTMVNTPSITSNEPLE